MRIFIVSDDFVPPYTRAWDSAYRRPRRLAPGGPKPVAAERAQPFYRPEARVLDPQVPQNIEAECAVLGGIMLDATKPNQALEKVSAIIDSEDFFHVHHKLIFRCMKALGTLGTPIEPLTLTDALRRDGKLEAAGGAAYLSQLIDGRQRVSNVEHYARIVREKSRLLQLIYKAEAIEQSAFNAEEDVDVLLDRATVEIANLSANGNGRGDLFDTVEEFENTPDPTFSIKDFLQDYGVTAIAGLSDHGKTWLSLNLGSAMLFGPGTLWNQFEVTERAQKIIYLIPEASRATFKKRLKLMHLYDEINKRFFVRTLTKGPVLQLTERDLLRAVKGAHVFCDTAIRFMKAVDENSASEAAQGLSDDFFALQRAEAKSIIALFHSPKSFVKERVMTLEGMIRGTSEFGAVLATAWGLRQIDRDTNTIHIENLKDRDFQSCGPFQLIGRPFIDQEGTFRMHRRPGDCGKLSAYLEDLPGRKSSGAPPEARQERARRVEMVREWLAVGPQTAEELIELFKKARITVSESAVKSYRKVAEGRGGE